MSVNALMEYKDKLYASTYNFITGTEVWRYNGAAWTQVNTDGFGDAGSLYSDAMVIYDDKLLVGASNYATGGQIWEYDGTSWTNLVNDGFGDTTNLEPFSLLVDGSLLYAGTWNLTTGTEIWKYDGATWSKINTDGFGDINNETGLSLAKFDNYIYASTKNTTTGGEVWKYDGTEWDRVNTDGFGDANNSRSYSLTVFRHKLYTGTFNENTGAELWQASASIPSLGIVMTPASAGGANIRVVDASGTQISSFFAFDQSLRLGLEVEQADIDGDGTNEIIVAPAGGVTSVLKAFELDGTLIASATTYDLNFKGGVSLTTGDLNGDDQEDIALVPTSLGGPHVRIYTLNETGDGFSLLDSFFPYDQTFRGGVNLATGDLNGDGMDRLVTAPISGHSPLVRTYSYDASEGRLLLVNEFQAYQTTYLGGVQLATGDMNGDKKDDIIVSPYLNGGPNVRVYNYGGASLISWVMAYPSTYRGTLSMRVGDLEGDGLGEIVLAAKTLSDSKVKIFRYENHALGLVDSFYPYDANFLGGVNLFVNDVDGDTYAEVMTSPASRGGPNVRVYDLDTEISVLKGWFWAFPIGFRGGVNFGK
ncbi:MAG: FG-GAP-like repeat-containing protein [Patescibacteria group bacterium]